MRNLRQTILASLLLAALAGCTTASAPERISQTAPDANLTVYRTFGWRPAVGDQADAPLRIVDANIRSAIRAELSRRGYAEAATNPELLITWETLAEERVKPSPFQIGVGIGSFGRRGGGSVNVGTPGVQSFQEGRLAIHVLDAAANREVWYGTGAERIAGKNLDAEGVGRVVALVLQDFPARTPAPAP
ncbi:MAG: DUF4136 domain-containing protein [Gammaproteobacteria bacterium]